MKEQSVENFQNVTNKLIQIYNLVYGQILSIVQYVVQCAMQCTVSV